MKKDKDNTGLKNKMLVYDSDCPMCQAYSSAFVKLDLLQKKHRVSFYELQDKNIINKMDEKRSRNEIPLIDLTGGETLYGVDSLLAILSARWNLFSLFKTNKILNFIARKLYAFISYNRKIIVPSQTKNSSINTSPSFHFLWRFVFIIFMFSIGNMLLGINPQLGLTTDSYIFFIIIFLLQGLAALFVSKSKSIDYLGHLSLIWFIMGLLLSLVNMVNLEYMNYIMPLVFVLVYFEHYRRTEIIGYTLPIHVIWLVTQTSLFAYLLNMAA